MKQLLVRAAAAAFLTLAVSACGGGGGSSPAPGGIMPLSQQQQPASGAGGAPATVVATVPSASTSGVLVSVHLPVRNSAALDTLIAQQTDQSSPQYHRFLTPDQFRAQYGPAAADLATANAYLRGAGFTTVLTSQGVLAMSDQGTAERAFSVHLRPVTGFRAGQSVLTAGASSLLATDRAPALPQSLAKLGATVAFARLKAHVHSKHLPNAFPDNRYGVDGPYWFTDLKQAYTYPAYQEADGSGRTIAIVISSDILDSDLALYFGHEKLSPYPQVERRPVLGGAPFDPSNDASFEASLDVQQSLGSAPGAHLLLYDIPDLSDESIFSAYVAIVDDNKADVVSSSFGECELYYTAAYNGGVDYTSILQQFHDVFRQGNAQGITFVNSSGDDGAYGCLDPSGSYAILGGAESFASDPDVTGVGGTNLQTTYVANGSRHSAYVSENAYDDPLDPSQGYPPNDVFGSGGGISQVFSRPAFQRLVNTHSNMRTVPDIAMHMGGCPLGALDNCLALPRSSVVTAVGGQFWLLVGTSASSPEFAGLLAVTEGHLGVRLGNVNNYIYALSALGGSQFYHNNIPGNNGYPSTPGYNYVLGNGTPKAAAFTLAPFDRLAGDPWTPSNP